MRDDVTPGCDSRISRARAMPPKKAEEAAAPPAADDDGLAELATRALPPAFDDDALAALAIGKAGGGSGRGRAPLQ